MPGTWTGTPRAYCDHITGFSGISTRRPDSREAYSATAANSSFCCCGDSRPHHALAVSSAWCRARRGLALQFLGTRPHLVWYLPTLADSTATGGNRTLLGLPRTLLLFHLPLPRLPLRPRSFLLLPHHLVPVLIGDRLPRRPPMIPPEPPLLTADHPVDPPCTGAAPQPE
ncbi:hypothetical protein [Streptomyces sp. NPDC058045]|uniref:hypothetical protein n=1 Tax=Streptomyces sp. NPDC058045 TaxID=3346311 RepID=UPI0036EAA0AB